MSQAPAARYSRWTDSQLFAASLVAPIFGYSLLLQILRISERGRFLIASGEVSWLTGVALLGSTFAFNVGLGLFCAVLLLVRDQGRKRWIFTGLVLQAIGLLFSTTETIAYVYFLQTGDALDWPLLAHMFRQLDDLKLVLAGDVSVIQWFQLAFAIAVACAAPWLVRAWSRRWKLPPYPGKERRSRARARVAFTLSVPVAALGLLPPVVKVNDTQLVRHPVLVVLETMVHGLDYGDATVDEAMAAGRFYSPDLTISKIPGARQRNLVIILLESTRASATTPYRPDLETTPFLAEIARKSLMIDRAYAVIPSTAKAITATLCSLYPSTSLEPRALTTGLLGRCLPQLLREQGYQTVYMQTANERFENRVNAVRAMGFERFVKPDEMPKAGFEVANFLGYEDETMLAPNAAWLKEHAKKGPIFATYLTVNAHHDYGELTRYGTKRFSGVDENFDRYLNDVRVTDFFLRKLVQQYKDAGLYDDTLFIFLGDHGEAFGEHGRRAHNTVPYEEGLRIPMLLFDPSGTLLPPGHVPGPVSQLDVVPTVLPLLGFDVDKGTMHGVSILKPQPNRVLMTSCAGGCAARITPTEAMVFLADRGTDELYDLEHDPMELHDLAPRYPLETRKRREELTAFLQRTASFYYLQTLRAPKAMAAGGSLGK